MDSCKEKIKYPFKCPVCGKEEFEDLDWFVKEAKDDDVEVYELDQVSGEKIMITDPIEIYNVHCSHCGWVYDLKQVLDYNVIGDRNQKTINDLKQEYQSKLKENPNYNYAPHAVTCSIAIYHDSSNGLVQFIRDVLAQKSSR